MVAQWDLEGNITRTELTGATHPTTNNAMEMQAAIEGLRFLTEPHHVYLVSDSAYLLNTLRFEWDIKWKEEAELHPSLPVRPNWEMWNEIRAEVDRHEVEFVKVKGHSGDPYNERADKLALGVRKAFQQATATLNP